MKRFLSEVRDGVVPQTLWFWKDVGSTRHSKQELSKILEAKASSDLFITPKPSSLIKRSLQIASDPDSLILDSFAGSGTTMHAVMALNREDGGNRRCIMVEMEEDIAQNVTAERIRRVMAKHAAEDQESGAGINSGAATLPALPTEAQEASAAKAEGGQDARPTQTSHPTKHPSEGFRYCTLGDPLFDADGTIRDTVKYKDLAHHVFFTETGTPLPPGRKNQSAKTPYLGTHRGKAYYLLFNGIMGDRSADGGNVLTRKTLEKCLASVPAPEREPGRAGPDSGATRPGSRTHVIYGEGCRLAPATLQRLGVTFKQLPYDLETS